MESNAADFFGFEGRGVFRIDFWVYSLQTIKQIAMNTTKVNSNPSSSLVNQPPENQVVTKNNCRRRDLGSLFYLHHLDQNHQTFFQSSKMDDPQNPTQTRTKAQVNEDKAVEKVSDPNRIKTDTEGHLPEDDKQPDPNKEIEEENNYTVDEEGSIIKEPTREVDDPYRPGHNSDKSTPSNKKEVPNPKKNTETDF